MVKAAVCKTAIHGFNSHLWLQKKTGRILCVHVFISGQILNLLKVYGGITMVGRIDVASVSVGKYD